MLKLNSLDLDGSALANAPFDLDQSQQKPVNNSSKYLL